MILIAAALACVACVPLTGGRLGRLLDLQLRCGWAALSALALQVIITTLAPTGPAGLHAWLHAASYALAGAYIVANRRITGLPILALGAALNYLAIIANTGIMPASARAMRLAGLAPANHFANSAPVAHPHLLALGDVIPVPGPWPLGNVISIGDILIITGLLTVLHHASRATPSTPPSDALREGPSPGQRDRVDQVAVCGPARASDGSLSRSATPPRRSTPRCRLPVSRRRFPPL